MTTFVSKSGSHLLVWGSTLTIAVILGAAVANPQRLGGSPYALVGLVLAAIVAVAILLQWRLGVIMLLATLPYASVMNVGPIASGTKVLALLTFFSLAVALLRTEGLFERFLKLWRQPLTLAVFALVLWNMASILWASNQGAALTATITFVGVFALMVVVGMLEYKYLFLAWLLTALSTALSIPMAYVLPQSDKMAELGRFGVGGADPNAFACTVVMILLVTYFGLGQHTTTAYILVPVLLYGIFATQSRTGLLALALTPLLAFFVPRLAVRLPGRTLLMYGFGLAVFVVLILVVPAYGETLLSRYETISQYQDEDTWSGRWSIWQGAFQVIASAPILGVGAGNFAEAAVKYSTFVFENTVGAGETTGVAHNMFLSVASQLGVVGLAMFLAVLFFAFKAALSVGRRSALGAGVFLGLIAYVISGISLTWEYQKIGYILLGSVLSMALQLPRHHVSPGEHEKRR